MNGVENWRTHIKDNNYVSDVLYITCIYNYIGRTHTHAATSTNYLQSTMSCVLSEESEPTSLEAIQVMAANALSLVTLVAVSVLVTLSSAMEASVEMLIIRVVPSSLKGTPFINQEMVGAGTPVAVHVTSGDLPSDTVTVGFDEMVATGATANGEPNSPSL